jgi:hypothetical protein
MQLTVRFRNRAKAGLENKTSEGKVVSGQTSQQMLLRFRADVIACTQSSGLCDFNEVPFSR